MTINQFELNDQQTPSNESRRLFMGTMAALIAAYPLQGMSSQSLVSAPQNLKEPWLTIDAVQNHLFPQDDTSPGAQQIGALSYLQTMLRAPDIDKSDKDFIPQGVNWLNDLSIKTHSKSFIKLNTDQKESILRKVEQSRAGERWLSLIMTYLIEALLADPVYAGNPGGIGWDWLNHQPGFPRPSKDKMYFKLGHVVRRSIKA